MSSGISVKCRCGTSFRIRSEESHSVFSCPQCGQRGQIRSKPVEHSNPISQDRDESLEPGLPTQDSDVPKDVVNDISPAPADDQPATPDSNSGEPPFQFDAFISYRHADLDRFFAERLHQVLEAYRVPQALVRQGTPRRLKRVFRDRDELDAAENLTETIKQALKFSRFLIVVCSPRTPGSIWVGKEIEYFRTLGPDRQILALLIEGEPAESFPHQLTHVMSLGGPEGTPQGVLETIDPLAADIRASTRPKSLKLLATEKLRLLAPMLGCRFDDLHRRELRRRRQTLFSWSLFGVVGCSILLGLAWQTRSSRKLAETLDIKATKYESLAATEEAAKTKALEAKAAAERQAAEKMVETAQVRQNAAEQIKSFVDLKVTAEEKAKQLALASSVSEDEKRRHAFCTNLGRASQIAETTPDQAISFLCDPNLFPQDLQDFAWGYRLGQIDPPLVGQPIGLSADPSREPPVILRHFSNRYGLAIQSSSSLAFWNPLTGSQSRSIDVGGTHAINWERGIYANVGTILQESTKTIIPSIHLFNLESGSSREQFPAITKDLTSLALSPDGRLLAGMTALGNIGLWDLESSRPIGAFDSQGGLLQFSADSEALMTCDLNVRRNTAIVKTGQQRSGSVIQIWPVQSILPTDKQTGKPAASPSKQPLTTSLRRLKIKPQEYPLTGAIAPAYFSQNGHLLVTGSPDGFKAWSIDRQRRTDFQSIVSGVKGTFMNASPDGRLLILQKEDESESNRRETRLPEPDRYAEIYDLFAGQVIQKIRIQDTLFSLTLSDNNRLLTMAQRGSIVIRDLGHASITLGPHPRPVVGVALSDNGNQLAAIAWSQTGYNGTECSVWSVADVRRLSTFTLANGNPHQLPIEPRFIHKNQWLSLNHGHSIDIVNKTDGTQILPQHVVSAMSDGPVPIFVCQNRKSPVEIHSTVNAFASPNIQLQQSEDGSDPIPLSIPELTTPDKTRRRDSWVTTLSPNGKWLAIGCTEQSLTAINDIVFHSKVIVRPLNELSGRTLECGTLTGFSSDKLSVAVSNDGRWTAATFYDDRGIKSEAKFVLRIWETESGREGVTTYPDGLASILGFIGHGDNLLLEMQDGSVELWNAPKAERLASFPPAQLTNSGNLRLVPRMTTAVSPDGKSLAISTNGGRILLVDPVVGAIRDTLTVNSGVPCSLAFSGDGRTLAAGMSDGVVRLWFSR